jgi:hypothetical protein
MQLSANLSDYFILWFYLWSPEWNLFSRLRDAAQCVICPLLVDKIHFRCSLRFSVSEAPRMSQRGSPPPPHQGLLLLRVPPCGSTLSTKPASRSFVPPGQHRILFLKVRGKLRHIWQFGTECWLCNTPSSKAFSLSISHISETWCAYFDI